MTAQLTDTFAMSALSAKLNQRKPFSRAELMVTAERSTIGTSGSSLLTRSSIVAYAPDGSFEASASVSVLSSVGLV